MKLTNEERMIYENEIIKLLQIVVREIGYKNIPYIIMDRAIWAWTERFKKYDRQCLPWSENAKLLLNNNIKLREKNKKLKKYKGLRHEHMVPRKVLIEKIRNLQNKNEASIREILVKYSYAAIITKDEDDMLNNKKLNNAMPEGKDDIWSRYDACGIVFDISERNKIKTE